MKRVNAMTKVLQQHGFANDAGDGVSQSQRIFGVNQGFEQATVVEAPASFSQAHLALPKKRDSSGWLSAP